MAKMIYLKAFIVGVFLPSVILPIGICIFWGVGMKELLRIPYIHLIPLIWGYGMSCILAISKIFFPVMKLSGYF